MTQMIWGGRWASGIKINTRHCVMIDIGHSQSPNNGIPKSNGVICPSKVYFLVNLKSCHAKVLNWAIRESIRPVELAQYRIFPYWASSTGRIFSCIVQLRTLAWQLSEFTRGCATEVFPHEVQEPIKYGQENLYVPFAMKEFGT